MTFSKNASFLAAGDGDKIRVFNVPGEKEVGLVHTGFIRPQSIIDPRGRHVAAWEYGTDARVKVFDAKTGALLNELLHKHPQLLAPCFSPDGEGLATVSIANDKPGVSTVTLWNLKTGKGKELFLEIGRASCRERV